MVLIFSPPTRPRLYPLSSLPSLILSTSPRVRVSVLMGVAPHPSIPAASTVPDRRGRVGLVSPLPQAETVPRLSVSEKAKCT